MNLGLLITIAGLVVGATSSLLGLWLERDPVRPRRNGYLLSATIVLSTTVGVAQASLNRESNDRMAANMAQILDDLDTIGKTDPALEAYLAGQVRAQAAANPGVIEHIAERATARGEAPSEVLSRRGLSAADLSDLGLPPATTPRAPKAVAPPVAPVSPPAEPVSAPEAPVSPPPSPDAARMSGVTINGVAVDQMPVGDLAKNGVKLDDVKVDGVKIRDLKVGGVKLEDVKTGDLKVGDLPTEDLNKLEALKKLELKKLDDLRKAADAKKQPAKPGVAPPPGPAPK
jgi:hypothetical protein